MQQLHTFFSNTFPIFYSDDFVNIDDIHALFSRTFFVINFLSASPKLTMMTPMTTTHPTSSFLEQNLIDTIEPLIAQIKAHPLLHAIQTIEDLKKFSEIHVFAVYDFMCLIKGLQKKLLHYENSYWLPPKDQIGARLLHEIILEEETDQTPDGTYISHFEWYLKAMEQVGANTKNILQFLQAIFTWNFNSENYPIKTVPKIAIEFMQTTFDLIEQPIHVTASAFAYGRESITQAMFTPILNELSQQISNPI